MTDGTDLGEVNIDFLPMVGNTLTLENFDQVKAREAAAYEYFVVKDIQLTALYTPTTRETAMQSRDISSLSSVYTIVVERVAGGAQTSRSAL